MRHLIRRILFYICAVWVAITLDFFIPRLAPGDPVAALVGKMSMKGYVTPEMQQTLAATFGLDTHDPLWLQYFKYLGNLLHGNLGNSIQYFPTPVSRIIGQDIGWSIMLGAVAVVISFVLGCLFGIITAWKRGTTLSEEYVFMAKAKGLSEGRVMFWYAARNAVLPNITGFAIAIGTIVGGQLLTEMVFSYPGIGYALLQAVNQQDYAMVQSIFLIITLAVLGAIFLADMLYTVLDPRVRQERRV